MADGDKRDLTQGPVLGHLLRFVVPMSIGISASMAVGLIDAFWLGKLGTLPLAAVSFGFPVGFAIFSIAIGLGSGAVAAVSRVVATGDRERIRRLATDALLLGVTVIIAISIIGALSVRVFFGALGAEGELLDLIVVYMRIWFIGLVVMVAPMISASILRALGDAVLPSLIMILAALVNMALDPLLIFGIGPFPRLEVAGAALATVAANLVTFAIAASYVVFREKLIVFTPPPREVLLRHWREVARVGFPAAGSNMVNPVALTLIVAGLARFGPEAVAGFGVANRVEAFAIIPLFALSAAIGPMTGQNAGAGRFDRVHAAFRTAFMMCVGWALALALLLALANGVIAGAFSQNEATRAVSRAYLLITPITAWGYGFAMTGAAGFNGLSRPLPGLAMTVARSLGLYMPLAWIGGTLAGAPIGAFFGMAFANIMAGLVIASWVLLRAYPAAPIPAEAPAE